MKQKINGEFYLLGSLINKAAVRGKSTVYFKNAYNHTRILSLLANQGYIATFQEHKGFIVVRLNPNSYGLPSFCINKAKRLSRTNLTATVGDIKKLHSRSGGLSTLLLSTDKGIMNSLNASEKGVGGKILFKLY